MWLKFCVLRKFYDLLEVPVDASESDLKKAYRKKYSDRSCIHRMSFVSDVILFFQEHCACTQTRVATPSSSKKSHMRRWRSPSIYYFLSACLSVLDTKSSPTQTSVQYTMLEERQVCQNPAAWAAWILRCVQHVVCGFVIPLITFTGSLQSALWWRWLCWWWWWLLRWRWTVLTRPTQKQRSSTPGAGFPRGSLQGQDDKACTDP